MYINNIEKNEDLVSQIFGSEYSFLLKDSRGKYQVVFYNLYDCEALSICKAFRNNFFNATATTLYSQQKQKLARKE